MTIIDTKFTKSAEDALRRFGEVEVQQDARSLTIELHHQEAFTIDEKEVEVVVGKSFIRLTKRSDGFELVSIHVDDQYRGKVAIVLNLIRMARSLLGEAFYLSSMRSPHGKRLGNAMQRLGWTYVDSQGREWMK